MTTTALVKGDISLRLAYNFKGLVHYHYGGKYGVTQADIVLEKEMRVLYPDRQATGQRLSSWVWFACLRPQNPPSVTHFLQGGHTY